MLKVNLIPDLDRVLRTPRVKSVNSPFHITINPNRGWIWRQRWSRWKLQWLGIWAHLLLLLLLVYTQLFQQRVHQVHLHTYYVASKSCSSFFSNLVYKSGQDIQGIQVYVVGTMPVYTMDFILDGCSLHVAHVWCKRGLFPRKKMDLIPLSM